MTDEERKALVMSLRQGHEGPAAKQIEADGQRISELDNRAMEYLLLSDKQAQRIAELEAENERLRLHLDVALETLAEEGVCGDECITCKEARAALGGAK